jgi:uncharacterized RDD family membrane protein YckC
MNHMVRRYFNFIIDAIIIAIVVIAIFITLNLRMTDFNVFLMYALVFLLYYFFLEYFFLRTLGKLLTNTKVEYSKNCSKRARMILIRTLSRFLPFEPFSIFFTNDHQMWHDTLSCTHVIHNK